MWTFILTKLDCTKIGEVLNASERSLELRLNGASTASFTIRSDSDLIPNLFGEDTLLQVWQDKTIRFHGFVVSTQMSGTEEQGLTVSVNAIDPAWRLSKRVMDPDGEGLNYEGQPSFIAAAIIDRLNHDSEEYPDRRDTRISVSGGALSETPPSIPYQVLPFDTALKGVTDMAHQIGGFDWRIAPLEGELDTSSRITGTSAQLGVEPPITDGGEEGELLKIGYFSALSHSYPTFEKSETVFFEHGFGKHNISSINYKRDLEDMVNKAYHLPDEGLVAEGGHAKNVLFKRDLTAMWEHSGLFEEVADAPGLNSDDLRNAWLEEVIRVKKNPRYVVDATLRTDDGTGQVPSIGDDFFLGDRVTIRSKIADRALFSGVVRVYSISVSLDESGNAEVSPTFLDEEGSSL